MLGVESIVVALWLIAALATVAPSSRRRWAWLAARQSGFASVEVRPVWDSPRLVSRRLFSGKLLQRA